MAGERRKFLLLSEGLIGGGDNIVRGIFTGLRFHVGTNNGVEGTVTCYRYSVTVTGYSYTVSGYSYTVTGYSSLPLKNCLTMAISVAPSLVTIIINKLLMMK